MSYEAAVFDFYDDGGRILKQLVPQPEMLPAFVKTASVVARDAHPNQFALVMEEEGRVLKRFPTSDAGNTWLSALYFHATHDGLPKEAQVVAAANLHRACEAFDITPPDVVTELVRDLDAEQGVQSNFVSATGQLPPMAKEAEVEKVEIAFAIERADGSKHYPLSSAEAVVAADRYFTQNHGVFHPRDRREFAIKTAAVAESMGLPVGADIEHYAGGDYSPALAGHLLSRHHHLVAADAAPEVLETFQKLAAAQKRVSPDKFADLLARFDEETTLDAMWDRGVADPWYSTFGFQKTASDESFTVGDAYVTEEELRILASRGRQLINDKFGGDIAKAFCNDPVTIFKSMPAPQKLVFARLASGFMGEV